MRKPNYYLVICNNGHIECVSTYPLAEHVIEEQGGGFCKGCANLEEVEAFKKFYAKPKSTPTDLSAQYRAAMQAFLTSNGRDLKAKKILERLAKLGIVDQTESLPRKQRYFKR